MSTDINVAVLGVGGVGKAFISQLEALSHRLLSLGSPINLNLFYVARSSAAIYSQDSSKLSYQTWSEALSASSTPPLSADDLSTFLSKASTSSSSGRSRRAILVDNTASAAIGATYPIYLRAGVSVVAANKKGFAADVQLWDEIYASARNGTGPIHAGLIYHESSCGAGLPIISTLRDLVETGDIVTRVEGVFSGTMSYLFNTYQPVTPAKDGTKAPSFSEVVKAAKEAGFTEPDPREDLNGLDVARKLTILARILGIRVTAASPDDFPVQSLVPKELESASSGDEFMTRLHEFDAQIDAVKADATAEGKVVRFVGSVDVAAAKADVRSGVEVGLKKFDAAHPIAALKGSDNIIAFYTKRYGPNPLVVQGAGAGAEVTAMGVTGDLIKVMNLIL